MDTPQVVVGCSYCNYTGSLHTRSAPQWVPRVAGDPDKTPCPYCYPAEWEKTKDEWNTGPGAHTGE